MDLKELYQDIILEHGKSPRNFGKCDKHSHEAKGHNPLCGDQVQVYLRLNEKKTVEQVTFEGSGCAISIASTSIMTELVKGKNFNVAKNIIDEFLNMIKNGKEIKTKDLTEDQKTKIMSLSGVKQYPMRVKCATLSWHTLISAFDGKKMDVNTEKLD
jgi:nitrogen fixation protein NifU and related proteins